MARIKDAVLRAEGQGRQAVFTVELEVDWDRSDRDQRFELAIRFIGADAVLRGGDEVVKVHVVPVGTEQGDRLTVSVDNADGVFDEDAGQDEIVAECELRIVPPSVKVVRTNKVTGRF